MSPEEVADRLHSAAIHLLRSVRREDTAAPATPAQLSALSVLVFGGPRTVGQLAEAEQVTPPTISRLVSTLDAAGLVERSRSGRVVTVTATPAGRAMLVEGRRRRVRRLAAHLAALSDDELRTLAAAADILDRAPGATPGLTPG